MSAQAASMPPFHLAFPVRDIEEARQFYVGLLGCGEGRSAPDWVDFDFYGHQVVAHLAPDECGSKQTSAVDDHQVPVRHFGAVLSIPQWEAMATKLKEFATTLVAVVEPETSARVVAQLMRRHHIGALVVVDAQDKNKPVGNVTDRDLVLELMAEGLDPAVFTAGDIMSVDLVTAGLEMDAMDAVQLMRKYRLRRLVITDATV